MSGPPKESVPKPAEPANNASASTASAGPAADPTMEDILASIRRILNEEGTPAAEPERRQDVLVLDDSMMVSDPNPPAGPAPHEPPPHDRPQTPPAQTAPATAPAAFHEERATTELTPPSRLVAPEAAAAAAAAVGSLVKRLASERGAAVSRNGPTIEDLVREELRPLLKSWLDTNLPVLVERVVRAEIERILARGIP